MVCTLFTWQCLDRKKCHKDLRAQQGRHCLELRFLMASFWILSGLGWALKVLCGNGQHTMWVLIWKLLMILCSHVTFWSVEQKKIMDHFDDFTGGEKTYLQATGTSLGRMLQMIIDGLVVIFLSVRSFSAYWM